MCVSKNAKTIARITWNNSKYLIRWHTEVKTFETFQTENVKIISLQHNKKSVSEACSTLLESEVATYNISPWRTPDSGHPLGRRRQPIQIGSTMLQTLWYALDCNSVIFSADCVILRFHHPSWQQHFTSRFLPWLSHCFSRRGLGCSFIPPIAAIVRQLTILWLRRPEQKSLIQASCVLPLNVWMKILQACYMSTIE